ncbi:hypothetical protein RHSIM_Rhsim07G0151600 [Rhododendron simsii]|uniref:Uncharacterized protein n=1 Tax=Rhododendron simsii TaxID=118357 RepID=A0A834GLU9_RHOSS|nr:hypothetical protein RHSIM_Rhsim07G0151600 [Rhododendron simsii]
MIPTETSMAGPEILRARRLLTELAKLSLLTLLCFDFVEQSSVDFRKVDAHFLQLKSSSSSLITQGRANN